MESDRGLVQIWKGAAFLMSMLPFYQTYTFSQDGELTDKGLKEFLRHLDMAVIELNEWEQDFVDENKGLDIYTEGSQIVIKRLIQKYGHRLTDWG